MITIKADKALKQLRKIQTEFPKQFNSAMVTASMAIKKKASQAIGGAGKDPLYLQGFAKETKDINKAIGRRNKLGGVLSKSIKSFAKKGVAYIGWPTGLTETGESFQQANRHERNLKELTKLRKGYKLEKVSKTYSKPERNVWYTISKWHGLPALVLKAVVGKINAMMSKTK